MHLAPLALSILSLGPAPQDAPLELVNRVEAVINDEIVTYRQLMGATVRRIPEGAQPTAQQLAGLRRQIGLELINDRLEFQGGVDMGFEEEAVTRIVQKNTTHLIDNAGGVIQMSEELEGRDLSLLEQEVSLRRNLYRKSWQRAVTGTSAGVSGRAYRDRYVRPGQLKLRYDLLEQGQPGAETIQGSSSKYHLQELVFPLEQGQTEAETTRVRAEEVRKTLLEGLDFTSAVRGSSNPGENDGVLPPLTSEQLVRSGGQEIAAFAISAKVGEISRPMPILRGQSIVGWRLMKLLDTDAPLLPFFAAPKTQTLLREAIQTDKDSYLRSEGLKGLNQGAYVWFSSGV